MATISHGATHLWNGFSFKVEQKGNEYIVTISTKATHISNIKYTDFGGILLTNVGTMVYNWIEDAQKRIEKFLIDMLKIDYMMTNDVLEDYPPTSVPIMYNKECWTVEYDEQVYFHSKEHTLKFEYSELDGLDWWPMYFGPVYMNAWGVGAPCEYCTLEMGIPNSYNEFVPKFVVHNDQIKLMCGVCRDRLMDEWVSLEANYDLFNTKRHRIFKDTTSFKSAKKWRKDYCQS